MGLTEAFAYDPCHLGLPEIMTPAHLGVLTMAQMFEGRGHAVAAERLQGPAGGTCASVLQPGTRQGRYPRWIGRASSIKGSLFWGH